MSIPVSLTAEQLPELLVHFMAEERSPMNVRRRCVVCRSLRTLIEDREEFSRSLECHGRNWSRVDGPFISTTSNPKWALKRAKEFQTETGRAYHITNIDAPELHRYGASVRSAASALQQCNLDPLIWTESEYKIEHYVPREAIVETVCVSGFNSAAWASRQPHGRTMLCLGKPLSTSRQEQRELDENSTSVGIQFEDFGRRLRATYQRNAQFLLRIAELEEQINELQLRQGDSKIFQEYGVSLLVRGVSGLSIEGGG